MKGCKTLLLGAALVLGSTVSGFAQDVTIQDFDIEIPAAMNVSYDGKYAAAIPGGFPVGIGSGMTYMGQDEQGNQLFYLIGDRGPNANAPKLDNGGKKPVATKMFPAPAYNPTYGILVVGNGRAVIRELITVKNEAGEPISGLPIPKGLVGSTGETALDDRLQVLPFEEDGMDNEGVAVDKKDPNYLWICDEYGPFIAKIEAKTGRIVKKYSPGKELPAIVAKRQANRGFEGIATTPSNKVLAGVQSICDVDGNVKKSRATFLRLVRLDPETGKTEMFAYPHDRDIYKVSREAKIGDLHAVDENRFLLVERGNAKDGSKHIVVYLIDIEGATDITGMKAGDGRELETVAEKSQVEKLGVSYVKKTLVLDLAGNGWKPGKAEGVALLPDGKTIAVSSDNDFGFKGGVVNPAMGKDGKPVKKEAGYVVDTTGKVTCDGNEVDSEFALKLTGKSSKFWLVTLPKPVAEY